MRDTLLLVEGKQEEAVVVTAELLQHHGIASSTGAIIAEFEDIM